MKRSNLQRRGENIYQSGQVIKKEGESNQRRRESSEKGGCNHLGVEKQSEKIGESIYDQKMSTSKKIARNFLKVL
jgi:hypothetical protein